jgi:hypothetical protein
MLIIATGKTQFYTYEFCKNAIDNEIQKACCSGFNNEFSYCKPKESASTPKVAMMSKKI